MVVQHHNNAVKKFTQTYGHHPELYVHIFNLYFLFYNALYDMRVKRMVFYSDKS